MPVDPLPPPAEPLPACVPLEGGAVGPERDGNNRGEGAASEGSGAASFNWGLKSTVASGPRKCGGGSPLPLLHRDARPLDRQGGRPGARGTEPKGQK